jgi:hypothetical protein
MYSFLKEGKRGGQIIYAMRGETPDRNLKKKSNQMIARQREKEQ